MTTLGCAVDKEGPDFATDSVGALAGFLAGRSVLVGEGAATVGLLLSSAGGLARDVIGEGAALRSAAGAAGGVGAKGTEATLTSDTASLATGAGIAVTVAGSTLGACSTSTAFGAVAGAVVAVMAASDFASVSLAGIGGSVGRLKVVFVGAEGATSADVLDGSDDGFGWRTTTSSSEALFSCAGTALARASAAGVDGSAATSLLSARPAVSEAAAVSAPAFVEVRAAGVACAALLETLSRSSSSSS